MKAAEIKELLTPADVRQVLESLGYEFNRSGQFRIREERTPSSAIDPKTGRIKDFGSGWGGDLFDLLQTYHQMTFKEAVAYVAGMLGLTDTDMKPNPAPSFKGPKPKPQPKDNEALHRRLEERAYTHLNAPIYRMHGSYRIEVPRYVPVEVQEKDGRYTIVTVDQVFKELFGGTVIEASPDFMRYLFGQIVGWNDYFQCPVIIVRDRAGRAVNIVNYRPKPPRSDYGPLPKYLQTKKEDRPDYPYLFPFEKEMMALIEKNHVCYVGEGLKNALNALTLGIPYISTESASTIKPETIEFIKTLKNKTLIGAFDGDEAGERAYNRMREFVPLKGNITTFKTKKDFTDIIREAA